MRKWWLLLIMLLVWAGGAVWWFREPLGAWFRSVSGGMELGIRQKLQPDPERYRIYLIGLDTHVGFIVSDGKSFRMIHSSGSRPWCVVDENRADAHVLQRSNWRMLGNLTADPKVLRRWLKAEKVIVRGT